MNKNELTRLIYTTVNEILNYKANITLSEAEQVYDTVVDAMKSSLVEGEEVRFPAFGKFHVTYSSARTITHPQIPGEKLEIGPTRQLRFKPYPSMKDTLNGRNSD